MSIVKSMFSVGDHVRVSKPVFTYERYEGLEGVITAINVSHKYGWHHHIKFDKVGIEPNCFYEHELDYCKSHIVTQILKDL